MKLFAIIDSLLVATRYLAWGIGLAGIVLSAILLLVNLSMGFASAMVFAAALLLSVAVTLLLLPTRLAKGKLADDNRRLAAGAAALVLASAVMGITYFACGGFPAVNLLFL